MGKDTRTLRKCFCGLQSMILIMNKKSWLDCVHLMQIFFDNGAHESRIIEETNTILPLPLNGHLHNLSRLSCSSGGS